MTKPSEALAAVQRQEAELAAFIAAIEDEIGEALTLYWSCAAEILDGGATRLAPLPPERFDLRRNFFTALFLYSYRRLGLSRPLRIFYTAVNQCLRGMVTGCDNLLDDEYKPTLLTDLPPNGTRFRSVLDIMVSDRALFSLLLRRGLEENIPADRLLEASAATLLALTFSGAQEAAEEGSEAARPALLPPNEVLETIHHAKTGLLFQAPWAAPRILETIDETALAPILEALRLIGLGCQVMDDMVDLAADVTRGRQNYVASLAAYGESMTERVTLRLLREAAPNQSPGKTKELAPEDRMKASAGFLPAAERAADAEPRSDPPSTLLPKAFAKAGSEAWRLLLDGLNGLLEPELAALAPVIARTLAELIGATSWVGPEDAPTAGHVFHARERGELALASFEAAETIKPVESKGATVLGDPAELIGAAQGI